MGSSLHMQEAFATMEELAQIHGGCGSEIIEECRKKEPHLARVIERWALLYEIAALRAERPEAAWFLRGKADVLRTDVPRLVKELQKGNVKPPYKMLAELRRLLQKAQDEKEDSDGKR